MDSGGACKFCKNGEVLFQNELFRVESLREPSCLPRHWVIAVNRHAKSEDELTGREKLWLAMTLDSAKKLISQNFNDLAACVDFCSRHFHLHLFEPVEFWKPRQNIDLMRKRVNELNRRYAGIEAEL